MKKITLIIGSIIFATGLQAQNSNVTKADAARNEGNFAEAIELIEPTIVHDKTKVKGRTWYIRGQIYADIATSEDKNVRTIEPDAVSKAIESFAKVKELEKPGSNYATLSEIQEQNLYNAVYNIGVNEYQAEDYGGAYNTFQQIIIMAPEDTLGYMFAAYSAQAGEEYEDALKMYYRLLELDSCPRDVYNQAIVINEQIMGDYEKVLEICLLGMEKFPEEQSFDKTAIAMYIKLERTNEALAAIEKALEEEPENANMWYNLGYLYHEVGENEKSLEAYKKSITVDPEHLNSYINMAYDYTQKANEILKENEQYNTYKLITQNEARIKAVNTEADKIYNEALPLLEKANEISPDDHAILESLNGIYVRLKMSEKAEVIQQQLIKLGYWDDN